MELVLASQNRHKALEIKAALPAFVKLKLPEDFGVTTEIPETGTTLSENALQKARFLHQRFNLNSFADDTGLEVEALNGAPGVYSARYAGEEKNAKENMNKLLHELINISDRKARFRTVIALIIDGQEVLFEGIVNGSIRKAPSGSAGFGYDPIFQPDGQDRTFAEMSLEEKNKLSHRGMAVQKLTDFLNTYKPLT